jgi:hypothetical protein
MSFTVADIVTEARELLLDTLAPFRYSDDFIVRKVNQAVRRMSIVRPDLFATHASLSCVLGILQSAPADSIRLMDVVTNDDGTALKEINQDTLDLMIPTWPSQGTSALINWMRYPRDPNRFYVYPAAAGTETLTIVYARSPATMTINSVVPLPDAYQPSVIDGTCWLMEAIDAEHVESGRAKMFKDAFEGALTAGLTVRQLTDADAGGLPKSEVK